MNMDKARGFELLFVRLSLDYISPIFVIFFLRAKVFFNVRNSIINRRLELTQEILVYLN